MVAAFGDEEGGGAGGRDGQRGGAAGFRLAAEDEGARGEAGGEVRGEIVIDRDVVRLGGFVAWGGPAVDEGAVVAQDDEATGFPVESADGFRWGLAPQP